MFLESISVVLPAYNEEKTLENTLRSTQVFLNNTFKKYEIIVVNDGSTDKTEAVAKKLQFENSKIKIINHSRNLGYGAAIKTGLNYASNDYIFFMDSDGQFKIQDIKLLTPYINSNTVVTGYRKRRADSIIRTINAFLYNQYLRRLFGLKVKDIDCAFKIFPKKAYENAKPIKSDGALFSAELMLKFLKKGYEIKETGVSHYPREAGNQSGANINVIMKMFKESWNFRKELM